jgi:hypothetical protein
MTAPVPTTEPARVVAGDTLTWSKSLSDYPATIWTLKYRGINAAGKFDITATASGTDYLITVTAAASSAWVAGDYAWTAWVEKGSGPTAERVTVGSGTITVAANIATLNTLDARTDAAKILDQLMAAYKSYTASNGLVAEYEIAGRRMKYRSAADILEQIDRWKATVAAEKRAERIAAGLGGGNKVLVRF